MGTKETWELNALPDPERDPVLEGEEMLERPWDDQMTKMKYG